MQQQEASKQDYRTLPPNASGSFHPFAVNTPQTELGELKTLLRLSRLGSPTYENSLPYRRFGLSFDWLQNAVRYWSEQFDWRKSEEHINSFPNFVSPIRDDDGKVYDIHFVGLFSQKKDAIPLLLLHGWPGSFLEFLPILDKLRQQHRPDTFPYHVVVPSLPGYAFSTAAPPNKDMRLEDTARLLNKLMISLGFGSDGYIVQGGDVGSKVARVIAAEHDACKAIHINFCIMPEPDHVDKNIPISAREQKGLHRANDFKTFGSSYALQHATRPSTIGFALTSNPVSLLAWISEKFLDWTDEDPPLDVILESVTLYWLTGCAATALWPYRQLFTPGVIGAHENPAWHIPHGKPFGYSWFPMELAPIPRAWAATTGNLTFYRQHDQGGHFAAVEKPDELWNDFAEFVQQAWTKRTT